VVGLPGWGRRKVGGIPSVVGKIVRGRRRWRKKGGE